MIGIIAAMTAEAEALISIMENKRENKISSVNFTSGYIHGKEVVCAVCGIGKVFAAITAQTMILSYKPDVIINTGVAGSLTDELGIFDVAVARCAVQYDMDTTAFGDPLGMISGLNLIELKCDEKIIKNLSEAAIEAGQKAKNSVIATGDRFIEDKDFKKFLNSHFGASACEMEGGSIGQVCVVNNIPFGIIRCISDGNGSDHTDYNTFMKKAAENSSRITEIFIKNYEV